ncbi:response regulator [Phaeobacter marinintestinus]|uniref:response regulator n=1 Tax=Falsiphaeobacter marinintestinus TaxID=1492905 RepID=UPI001648E1E0|nr:response regulator transcription factor [Phaeobacter marinintestinus]
MTLTLETGKSWTAVIADDHAILRNSIRGILEGHDGLSVVAEASDGLTAISLARQHMPDLLTLDIAMPYAQGVDVFHEVRRWAPDTRIVIFTGLSSVGLMSELVAAGVDGLFSKSGDPEALAQAIPVILHGGKVVAPEVRAMLEDAPPAQGLTAREAQILTLIAAGKANREIAEHLGVSAKTVDNHRTNLMRKLGVHSVAELLSYALREGYLETARYL